jgi:hypothetical protein
MAGITGTKQIATEFSGKLKVVVITAPVGSASDTVTLSEASHGITQAVYVLPFITAGYDASFCHVEASHSNGVITVTSEESDGTAATDFTGTTVALLVIGY